MRRCLWPERTARRAAARPLAPAAGELLLAGLPHTHAPRPSPPPRRPPPPPSLCWRGPPRPLNPGRRGRAGRTGSSGPRPQRAPAGPPVPNLHGGGVEGCGTGNGTQPPVGLGPPPGPGAGGGAYNGAGAPTTKAPTRETGHWPAEGPGPGSRTTTTTTTTAPSETLAPIRRRPWSWSDPQPCKARPLDPQPAVLSPTCALPGQRQGDRANNARQSGPGAARASPCLFLHLQQLVL